MNKTLDYLHRLHSLICESEAGNGYYELYAPVGRKEHFFLEEIGKYIQEEEARNKPLKTEIKGTYSFYTSKLLDELETNIKSFFPDGEVRIQITAEFDKFRYKLSRQTFNDTPIYISLNMVTANQLLSPIHTIDFDWSNYGKDSMLEHYEYCVSFLERQFDEVRLAHPEVKDDLILVMGSRLYSAINSIRIPILIPHCMSSLDADCKELDYGCFVFDQKNMRIIREIQGYNIV